MLFKENDFTNDNHFSSKNDSKLHANLFNIFKLILFRPKRELMLRKIISKLSRSIRKSEGFNN